MAILFPLKGMTVKIISLMRRTLLFLVSQFFRLTASILLIIVDSDTVFRTSQEK